MDAAVSGIRYQELLGRGRVADQPAMRMEWEQQDRQFCTGCLPLCGSPRRKSQGDSEG